MRYPSLTIQSVLLLSCSMQVAAFWRMVCGTIQTGRIDSIVNPGGLASHCHTLAGPINLNTTSTFASMQASYCTSCGIQQDKSAYWTPQMYYRHRNGSYEYVQHDGTIVYYLGRGTNSSNMVPFPPGLKMLSGDSGVRAYDSSTLTYENGQPIADRVSFACLDISGPIPETSVMTHVNCSDGLRAQIQFQTCWDGVNLYKTDQSHVAYLSGLDNGDCPPAYPYLMPHLFYEVLYAVNNIDQTDGGMFIFSNGDTTGYGFHGDFLNGWDTGVLTAAIAQCINNANSDIGACAPLTASFDPFFDINCPEQPPLINEATKGLIKTLPGCNPPTGGPGRAASIVCPIVPGLNPATNLDNVVRYIAKPGDVRAGFKYLGCSTDNNYPIRALNGMSYESTDEMSIESCTSFCHAQKYLLAGLEDSSQCYCGSMLPVDQPTLSVTVCAENSYEVCSGNGLEFCGAPQILQVWQDNNYQGPTVKPPPTIGDTTLNFPSGTAIYAGCHTEAAAVGTRALSGSEYDNSTTMTLELCGTYCAELNFSYFGTEFSSQCFCGNTITTATVAEILCYMPCSGDQTENCGAGNILSVWAINGAVIPSGGSGSGQATTVSTASLSTSTVVVSGTYLGCYGETNPRALGGIYTFSNNSVTNQLCAAYAQQLNLQYFYTEFSSQCYAGNILNAASVPISPGTCSMTCVGNTNLVCGGPNACSLYRNTQWVAPINPSPVNVPGQATAKYNYLGCYTEGNGARALGASAQFDAISTTSSTMTVEVCAAFCFSKGYQYMGVENAAECYCNGAGVLNGAVLGSGCTATCVASQYEYCGGASRINIYQRAL